MILRNFVTYIDVRSIIYSPGFARTLRWKKGGASTPPLLL